MENILETKTIRCRYGSETQVVKDYSAFGWRLISKNRLNRFGNRLPIDAQISESDKREKCSFELTFNRSIDPDKANKLSLLENEYDSLTTADTSFGKGRITGSIFLTLGLSIFLIMMIFVYTSHDNSGTIEISSSLIIMLFILALFLLGGLAAVIAPGVVRVVKAAKQNEEVKKRKAEILQEAEKILNN